MGNNFNSALTFPTGLLLSSDVVPNMRAHTYIHLSSPLTHVTLSPQLPI